jgi:hypothetical protein
MIIFLSLCFVGQRIGSPDLFKQIQIQPTVIDLLTLDLMPIAITQTRLDKCFVFSRDLTGTIVNTEYEL